MSVCISSDWASALQNTTVLGNPILKLKKCLSFSDESMSSNTSDIFVMSQIPSKLQLLFFKIFQVLQMRMQNPFLLITNRKIPVASSFSSHRYTNSWNCWQQDWDFPGSLIFIVSLFGKPIWNNTWKCCHFHSLPHLSSKKAPYSLPGMYHLSS